MTFAESLQYHSNLASVARHIHNSNKSGIDAYRMKIIISWSLYIRIFLTEYGNSSLWIFLHFLNQVKACRSSDEDRGDYSWEENQVASSQYWNRAFNFSVEKC